MTRLDIISDPICPWCYIGKSNLDKALAQRDAHPFDITWRPFQLNPDMPAEGMDRAAYLEAKFGGPDGAAEVYGRIEQAARDAGLEVDFAAMKRTPNTINAHRLIRWARIDDRQGPVVNQLFHRYFSQGQDISDPHVLLDVAHSAGLDADVMERLLAGDVDIDEVRAEDAEARKMGVQGVPCFIIGGSYAVSGAQTAEVWLQIIDELLEKAVSA